MLFKLLHLDFIYEIIIYKLLNISMKTNQQLQYGLQNINLSKDLHQTSRFPSTMSMCPLGAIKVPNLNFQSPSNFSAYHEP